MKDHKLVKNHWGDLSWEDGPYKFVQYGFTGNKYWYKNSAHHREDGPAIELSDGTKVWALNGKTINCSSQEEFLRIIKLKAFW